MGMGKGVKAWYRARGHHLCLTDTIFFFFFFLEGGVGGAGELWPFTLWEHWQITHYF